MISFISVAHASSHVATAQGFIDAINKAILFPVIALMMAIAFIVFLYGAFVYVKNANNDAGRETGRNHLIYGVIGMLVMLSAFAILNIAANTFGLSDELRSAQETPSAFAPTTSDAPSRRPSYLTDVSNGGGELSADGYDINDPRAGVYSPAPPPPPPGPEGDFEGPSGFGSDLSIDDSAGISISDGTNGYVPRSVPAQPLTPDQENSYLLYVDEYDVTTDSDEAAILTAYAEYQVTEVVFMVPIPPMYTQNGGNGAQAIGSLDQQEALCTTMGGSITTESGTNRVTSVSVYACLR